MTINQDLSGWNILLVDDDPAALDILVELLGYYGAKTQTAWNGEKALQLAKENAFDLIVTDLQMPNIDGLQLTRTLKADPQTQHIPIIILTAHSLDHKDAREAGCDALMTKPISPIALVDELKKMLPGHFGGSEDS